MVFRAAVVVPLITAACGETNIEVIDPLVDLETDDSLPDGFVADNRPLNPSTSFEMPCPWREVPDPADNPFLFVNVAPDAIQSIDQPKFVSIGAAKKMLNFEDVIVCEINGIVRAFPERILLYHEIVNMCWDTADGPKYSYLTYCPLVRTGVHFVHPFECNKPRRHSFGVSGGLYNGNLIVFDRLSLVEPGPTDVFVQMYAGGLGGSCTTVEPQFAAMSWMMFKLLYPKGEVLSEDTGFVPDGGYDYFIHPYDFHWRSGDYWFPLDLDDNRLRRLEPVYGVLTPGEVRAYTTGKINYVANERIGGEDIVVWNDSDLGGTAAFQAVLEGTKLTFEFLGRESHQLPLYRDEETGSIWTFDGIAVEGPLKGKRLPRATAMRSLWFAWAALYPETSLYTPGG
jgi:hypothetical protein